MEYRSQKIAYWYFAVALLLFVLQVVMGLWLAFSYSFTVPQSIVDVFPFATARAMHTNLLVLWMLLGFMGGTYYIVPEETKSEIFSTNIAWFQLIALVATGVAALVGFIFGWTQGRPLRNTVLPERGDRLVLLVVGHPSLGGRRLGTRHRGHFRVRPDEAHRC